MSVQFTDAGDQCPPGIRSSFSNTSSIKLLQPESFSYAKLKDHFTVHIHRKHGI